MDVNNKVALVTGAAIGIGFEISKELLKNDAKGILITDINIDLGQKALMSLSAQFGKERVHFLKTDVTNEDEFEGAFKKTIELFGKIDILINNAGIMNDLNYKLEIDINLNGVIRGLLLGLKYIGKNQQGSGGLILNICSTTSVELYQCFPIYSATKAGVLNLSRGFGHCFHYNKTGVAVLALCPGKTETALQAENLLFEGCLDELISIVGKQDLQRPDTVGRAALHVIKNGSSGTIWIIDQNNLFTLHIPEWQMCAQLVSTNI